MRVLKQTLFLLPQRIRRHVRLRERETGDLKKESVYEKRFVPWNSGAHWNLDSIDPGSEVL